MKIRQLVIETVQPEALKGFYAALLEWKPSWENAGGFALPLQQSELQFRRHTGKQTPYYHFAINIPANMIDEARAWLVKKVQPLWLEDYQSDIADFTNWHARSVYFLDPAGNIVEFIARFDLDNAAADVFSARQFLSISEVGIVFRAEEFELMSNRFCNYFGIPWFSKQPPLPLFRAAGNDEGLFIMVPENRNWYPTSDRPAMMAPMQVDFSIHDVEHKIEYLNKWELIS